MNITPTLKEVQNIAAKGLYQILPVSCEILSDFTTPLETMKILKQVSTHCYLLESAVPQGQWGRYSFLGYDPKLEITCRNGNMKIGDLKLKTSHPSNYIRQIMAERKSPGFSHLPPFTGGGWLDIFLMIISARTSTDRLLLYILFLQGLITLASGLSMLIFMILAVLSMCRLQTKKLYVPLSIWLRQKVLFRLLNLHTLWHMLSSLHPL